MEHERQILRIGAAAIGAAIVLRLIGGLFSPAEAFLTQPETGALLLYLESGRAIHPTTAAPTEETHPPETTPPTDGATEPSTPSAPEKQPAAFSAEDASLLHWKSYFDYTPDGAKLLAEPLTWSLRQDAPTVLILHTHTTESYTKRNEAYTESSAYRTLDENYNMVSIGDRLTQLLQSQGIQVVHDRTLHDYPSYNGSYSDAREASQAYLAQYPQIQLIIDLHRDAAEDTNGGQIAFTAPLGGAEAAQLMFVVGSNSGGLTHPHWEQNLAIAAKLQATLEKQSAGISRGVTLSTQRYNQDLLPGAMLIEVGAAGNTHDQALASMDALAKAIVTLADGTAQ